MRVCYVLVAIVSSNLTPSATLISDLRFGIFDWEKKPRRKQSAENSENRCEYHIGKIMRADINPREAD